MKTFTTTLLICISIFQSVAQVIEKTIIQHTFSTTFYGMTSADLNNDGIDDIIGFGQDIIWYEGLATEAVGPQHVLSSALTGDVTKCFPLDINDDGKIDLMYQAGTILGWLENPGGVDDNWTVHQYPGLYSNFIGLFDFDSDGDDDLIYEDNLTYLGWRENIAGSYATAHTIPDSYSDLTFSAAEDYDQDGDIDWVGYFYDCCTKYFKNNGNATFTVSTPSNSECVKPVVVSDINNDGYTDIFYYDGQFHASYFAPLTGTFANPVTIGDLDDYIGAQLCDVDNDNDKDWIFWTDDYFEGEDTYKYYCVLNNEAGFDIDSAVVMIPHVDQGKPFYSFTDLNNDHFPELITEGDFGGIDYYLNNGTSFTFPETIALDHSPRVMDLICFDIDGDPDNDILFATETGELYWYEYDHTVDSFTVKHPVLSLPDYPTPTNIKKKDIDGDGDFDLVVSFEDVDGYPEVSYYCLNDGHGNFTNYYLDNESFDNIWFIDADADGDLDLLGMDGDADGNLMLYKNSGIPATLYNYFSNLTPSGNFNSYVQFDIDNDGDDDMVAAKSAVSWLQKIENTDGAATFASPANFINCSCSPTYSLFAADFDNDGDFDIIYTCSSGQTYLATNDGGTYTHEFIGTFDATLLTDGSHTGIFDLNADGFKDIHYNKTVGGSGYKLATGPGTFDETYDYFSEDYGRFGYVDEGGVVDFIGTNANEMYIQYNIVMLAPSFSTALPTKTWLEENGDADSVTFTFNTIPETELIIDITPSGSVDAGNGEGQPVELHIAADSTALIPHTVAWRVPDDAIVEDVTGSTVEIKADASTWGSYSALVNYTYTYTIADNDLGMFSSGNELTLYENAVADTIYAHFNMIPDAPVEIQIIPDPLIQFGFDAPVVNSFTLPAGFDGLNTFKMTTVQMPENYFPGDGGIANIQLDIISDETLFDEFIPDDITVTLVDNDIAGLQEITPTGSVSEGVEEFEISFTPQTALHNNLTVTAYPNLQFDLGNGPGMPVAITFASSDVIQATQAFTGIAFDDILVENLHTGYITFSVSTADPNYVSLVIPDLIIEINDNDAPQGINIVAPAPEIYAEGTTGLELSLALNTNPNSDVAIYAIPDAHLDLGAGAGNSVEVDFSVDEDATTPQIIPISIVNDYLIEGDHTGTISFEIVTFDPVVDAMTIDDITINIADDDEPQSVIAIYPAADFQLEGTSVEMTLSLLSLPNDVVTITATPDSYLDLGAGAGISVPFIFDPAEELTAQMIHIDVVNDEISEGDHTGVISFTITTTDPMFDDIAIDNAFVNISDYDDMQAVIVASPAGDSFDEGTTGIEMFLNLALTPFENVTVTATPDDQLDLGAGTGVPVELIFTTDNALMPQLITMAVAEDYDVEGEHTGTITYSIETGDIGFDGYELPSTIINIHDNDEAQGVSIVYPAGDYFTEGTTGIEFDFSLLTEAISTVVIHAYPNSQLDLGNGPGAEVTIIFDAGDDATVLKPIYVSIVDDNIVEGDHVGNFYFSIETDDPQFEGYSMPSIDVLISDNDEETAINNSDNGFNIYPAVSNGNLTIHSDVAGEYNLQLVNMAGEIVFEQIAVINGDYKLDLTNLAQGNYMLTINNTSAIPVQIVK